MTTAGEVNADLRSPFDLVWFAMIVATAVVFYLVGNAALSLALAAVLAALCWFKTPIAIVAIPLAVPLFMLPKTIHLHRQYSFSLGEIAIVLLSLIVFAQQVATADSRPEGLSLLRHFLPRTPFLWPALTFLAAAALAVLDAHFRTVALRSYREILIEPVLYYWLIIQRLKGSGDAALLALSLACAGIVVSAMGLFQLAFRKADLVYAQYLTPPGHLVRAVYGNENNLGLLIDRSLPVALALAIFPGWLFAIAAVRQGAAGLRVVATVRIALNLGTTLMLYILYRTGSRGGEAAVVGCLAVLYAVWQWRKWPALAAAAAVALAALVAARHRLSSFIHGGHGLSNDAHQSVWQSALRMARDHPLFGIGPDNFLYYYSDDSACAPGHISNYYYVQAGKNFERCISHPHNMFLDFWLSTGLLGLAAALALLGAFVVLGVRAFALADLTWKGPLLAALSAMLAFAIHGQVDNSYFLPDMAVYFWLCLGIVALWQRR